MTLADELERLWKALPSGVLSSDKTAYVENSVRCDLKRGEYGIAEFVYDDEAALIIALRNNLPAIIAALRAQEDKGEHKP